MRQSKIAMLAVCVVCSWSCSAFFVKQAPSEGYWQEGSYLGCTDGKALPVIDTQIALTSAAGAIVPAAISSSAPSGSGAGSATTTTATVGGLLALTHAISAGYGFTQTQKCRDYQMAVLSPDVRRVAATPQPPEKAAASEASSAEASASVETSAPTKTGEPLSASSEAPQSAESLPDVSMPSLQQCRTSTICSSNSDCFSGDVCVRDYCWKGACVEQMGQARAIRVVRRARRAVR